jgi:AcrR family transcriptional regulator
MARTPGLSKQHIVQAAIDLLDEVGVEALTVRALAAKLDVKAPALYWHVRDKRELADEMATEIWRRVGADLDALPAEITWDAEMRAFARITRDHFLAHRDGARVFGGTQLTDVNVLRRQERQLARWLEQGFELADVVRIFTLLYDFVIGFCIETQAVAQADEDQYSPTLRAERVGAKEHPLVAASGALIFGDPNERFEDLIDVLVDTAGRMRTGGL